MALGAITLHATRCAGEAGAGITLERLLDRQDEIAVGAGRDKSQRVVGHHPDDNAARPTARRLSPMGQRGGRSGDLVPAAGYSSCPELADDRTKTQIVLAAQLCKRLWRGIIPPLR